MADPRGFLKYDRELPRHRPVPIRVRDWREVYEPFPADAVRRQAARCMDCGVPFCHDGCPLGNLIPEWNDLVDRGNWVEASERLHATNNFPDFTGRLCPAPCEASCVLGISAEPVTIKQIEYEIVERAWTEGWLGPIRPAQRTGRRERRRRHPAPGGRWPRGGRRATLRSSFDAVLLATGATVPRDLQVPGRALHGVHQAMEYLTGANRSTEGSLDRPPIDAAGKAVVIIGGGDTGADCLGTAHRQGARSVHQLEILPEPPTARCEEDPWPTWPRILRTCPAHEEGGERLFSASTAELVGDAAGHVRALRAEQVPAGTSAAGRGTFEPVAGSAVELRCDLVLLALGFSGPERQGLVADLGLALTDRGTVAVDAGWETDVEGVFACGDAVKGQSLVVWAIAEGRAAAAAVDRRLMGASDLPAPVVPGQLPLR